MKPLLIICIVIMACNTATSVQLPPNILVVATDSALRNNNGTWLFKGTNFNGYIIEKNGKQLLSKLPIINGKENGTAYGWAKDGSKKYERNYVNGNREGYHRGWYSNGNLAFEYYFHNDKYEGEQKSFFENGQQWQSLRYANGYEDGKQKSWNDSGRIINNFTVKNGKLYGVIGRYDCMSVYKK